MLKSSKFEDKENVCPETGLPIASRRYQGHSNSSKEKQRTPFSDITPLIRELSFGVSDRIEGGLERESVRGLTNAGFQIYGKVSELEEPAVEIEGAEKKKVKKKRTRMKSREKVRNGRKAKGLALRANENGSKRQQENGKSAGGKSASSFLRSLSFNAGFVDKENFRQQPKGLMRHKAAAGGGGLGKLTERTNTVVNFMR